MADKKANTWRVTGVVTGSKYLGEFEAPTEAEAVAKALESEAASCELCNHCNDEVESPEIHEAVAEAV